MTGIPRWKWCCGDRELSNLKLNWSIRWDRTQPLLGFKLGCCILHLNKWRVNYVAHETLSGGSACTWYLNEDLPEINSLFERLDEKFLKVEWVSTGAEKFAHARSRADLPVKTVAELRDMDPWETEATDFLCTVTVACLTPDQAWWFWSCLKCHRSASMYG